MTENTKMAHDQKVQALAYDFKNKGYTVQIEPQPSDIPFTLANYQPDLIAIRGNEGIIVEVKVSTDRISVDRFREIAERIAEHKGWRFVLVTLDEPFDIDSPSLPIHPTDWLEFQQKLQVVDRLVQQNFLEPAVLYLWSIIETALRRRAEEVHLPVERFPTARIIKHLYSAGELSVDDSEVFKMTLAYRNSVAHGSAAFIDAGSIMRAVISASNLLSKWSNERT